MLWVCPNFPPQRRSGVKRFPKSENKGVLLLVLENLHDIQSDDPSDVKKEN